MVDVFVERFRYKAAGANCRLLCSKARSGTWRCEGLELVLFFVNVC